MAVKHKKVSKPKRMRMRKCICSEYRAKGWSSCGAACPKHSPSAVERAAQAKTLQELDAKREAQRNRDAMLGETVRRLIEQLRQISGSAMVTSPGTGTWIINHG